LQQQQQRTPRQAQQQLPQFRTYNLKTQVNAITILAVANTLLGGLLMVAVVLILCIMCASEKTLQQGEHQQTEAERRMDEAFPTIFMRMRRQAGRLFFWRHRKGKHALLNGEEPHAVAGTTTDGQTKSKGHSFRESLRRRFLGHRDKETVDTKLVEQENAEETSAVIRDNAEAAAANHPAEVHLDKHPHSQ